MTSGVRTHFLSSGLAITSRWLSNKYDNLMKKKKKKKSEIDSKSFIEFWFVEIPLILKTTVFHALRLDFS